jgi:hypothetical protein
VLVAFLVIPLADPAPVPCHVLPGSEPDPADAFGTSNIFRSLLLAVRSSTINKAIEYIILKSLIPDHWFLANRIHSTAEKIAIYGTPRGLVRAVTFSIRILLISDDWTYQSCV